MLLVLCGDEFAPPARQAGLNVLGGSDNPLGKFVGLRAELLHRLVVGVLVADQPFVQPDQLEQGNQFGERVKALAGTWLAAEEEQIAAARAEFESSMALDKNAEDRKKMSGELARALTELRAFARDATRDTLNKRWSEFDLWSRESEREITR